MDKIKNNPFAIMLIATWTLVLLVGVFMLGCANTADAKTKHIEVEEGNTVRQVKIVNQNIHIYEDDFGNRYIVNPHGGICKMETRYVESDDMR